MSWFTLKDQPSRKMRKGIFLRVRSNPDVTEAIGKSRLKRPMEQVWMVSILELRKDNEVLLEVWCQSVIDMVRNKNRHNVFHILMPENAEWVCEGDLGRGLK